MDIKLNIVAPLQGGQEKKSTNQTWNHYIIICLCMWYHERMKQILREDPWMKICLLSELILFLNAGYIYTIENVNKLFSRLYKRHRKIEAVEVISTLQTWYRIPLRNIIIRIHHLPSLKVAVRKFLEIVFQSEHSEAATLEESLACEYKCITNQTHWVRLK